MSQVSEFDLLYTLSNLRGKTFDPKVSQVSEFDLLYTLSNLIGQSNFSQKVPDLELIATWDFFSQYVSPKSIFQHTKSLPKSTSAKVKKNGVFQNGG